MFINTSAPHLADAYVIGPITMAPFEPSPRAAKRRKVASTTEDDDSSLPFHSRVLKTVRQAVYGKPASPKLDDVFAPQQARVTPVKKKPAGKAEPDTANVIQDRDEIDELGESVEGLSKRYGIRCNFNGTAKSPRSEDVGEPGTLRTPVKIKGKRKKHKSKASPDREEEGVDDGERRKDVELDGGDNSYRKPKEVTNGIVSKERVGSPNASTKKQRKKHKCWVYLEDQDELARGSAGGDSEDRQLDGQPLNRASVKCDKDRSLSKDSSSRAISNNPPSKEAEVLPEGDVPTPASRRKIDRLRKQLEIDMEPEIVLPVQLGHGKSPLKDSKTQRDSTDELAQGIESEQDDIMHTPSKSKRPRPRKPDIFDFQKSPSPDASPSTTIHKSSEIECQVPSKKDAEVLQKLLDDSKALTTLKSHILTGLTGKRRLSLVNLENEHQKAHQLVEQTVLAGEGNSMLIIGSRGSGKSALVETVISELNSEHQGHFHVVRLNGFIHTDDKLALREIWRQLGKEMDVDNDDLGGRSNYADTLTSLLALLAHPVGEEDGDQAATATSVVFILDEFDLFASHPRQTLLYNLFDVAQSRNAPVAVLGLTTKVNVVDSLEKRVKSRFGQRYVHLSLPKTFTAFQKICLSALSYHPTAHDLLQPSDTDLHQLAQAWNEYIAALFETAPYQQFLQTLYASTKSIPAFLSASLLPITLVTATSLPTTSSFIANSLLPPDSKLSLLPSLSTLELSLLIAAARLDIILSTDICTFGMVYEEYVSLASKSKMQSSAAGQMAVGGGARVWSKELAKGAWERLVALELVLPATGGGRGGKGEMWRVDVGLEEIGGCLEGMSGTGLGGLGKWCREI